ncbi:MAG: hypothetical protein HY818_00020 [Acetobacterium woodii]|nr:hypothetical protein [Acetobacterium woodii]
MDAYFDNLDFKSWFDMWHTHPDWRGYGNISWKHRHQHLKALVRRFNYLKGKISEKADEFQVFMMVDINDSGQDAVFIHTANPNEENFPVRFEEHKSQLKMSNQLKEFIESLNLEFFNYRWTRDNKPVSMVFLYDPAIGLPIRTTN